MFDDFEGGKGETVDEGPDVVCFWHRESRLGGEEEGRGEPGGSYLVDGMIFSSGACLLLRDSYHPDGLVDRGKVSFPPGDSWLP